jgi:glycerophosphoryl diester phosphodiesterase
MGRPTLIAQRGVHQVYNREEVDDRTCTARHIPPPGHLLIDNTLPSIAAAFEAGADVVEVDARLTQDHDFVLFHDNALECRTDGRGLVSGHTVAELKSIDVGYGYTADSGLSFPLRGKGIGMMPTLEEALSANPNSRFLIQFKDGGSYVGSLMVAYLTRRGLDQWDRLTFFGSERALKRLKTLAPDARVWSGKQATRCLGKYMALGWAGHVPAACEGGLVIVPVSQSGIIWGWPNRFLARMRAHQTEVMLIGRIDGLSGANFSRLDTIEELEQLPPVFTGSIWTDRIEIIGPALKRQ